MPVVVTPIANRHKSNAIQASQKPAGRQDKVPHQRNSLTPNTVKVYGNAETGTLVLSPPLQFLIPSWTCVISVIFKLSPRN